MALAIVEDIKKRNKFLGDNWTYIQNFIIVICYYTVACLFFCNVEGWSIRQTIYFTTVTITTVGYGDFSPGTVAGKIFGIFFILFGLSVVFTIIAGVALDFIAAAEARALAAADDDPTDNKQPHGAKIAISIGLILFCVFLGAIVFYAIGEFDQSGDDGGMPSLPAKSAQFLDCFWWSFVTLTTVGYGDLSYNRGELSATAQSFSIFFILFSVLVASVAIGNISSVAADIAREKKEAELLERLDFNMLVEMDTDGDGIDQNEYVIGMLQMLELVDEDKINMLREQFSEHDKDGSGRLDRHDLGIIAKEKELEKMKKKLVLKGVHGPALEKALAEKQAELDAEQTGEAADADAKKALEMQTVDAATVDIDTPPDPQIVGAPAAGDEEKGEPSSRYLNLTECLGISEPGTPSTI